MNPVFTGTIEKGKLKLDQPYKYAVRIAGLEGKKIELILRQQKSQRSLNQNAYYWGVVIEILKTYLEGMTGDEIHDALKIKFASRHDAGTGLTIVESTAKMNTKRFNEYFETIQRWAAEFLNCQIPAPNEIDYQDGDFI